MSDLREKLRAAIAAHDAAVSAHQNAERAVIEGKRLVRTAETALAEALARDKRRNAAKAASILQGASKGVAQPQEASSVPGAERELINAKDTLQILAAARDKAADDAEAKADLVHAAAAAIISGEAEGIARELLDLRVRASKLRELLLGLSFVGRGYGTNPGSPWPMSEAVLRAVNYQEPFFQNQSNPASTLTWRNYQQSLTQNPDARLDDDAKAKIPDAA